MLACSLSGLRCPPAFEINETQPIGSSPAGRPFGAAHDGFDIA
jgi:hypothetical protein